MSSKPQRDPEASRAALLAAAEEVFLEKGFGNTSLSEIARRAGMTKSLIHHYFGSKDNLWREVKLARFTQYTDRQMEMIRDAQPTPELMRASLAFYFEFLRKNPQIVRILAWMFLERDQEDCLDIDRGLIEHGIRMMHQAQAEGQVRSDIDARFILFVFIGLCQHWFQDKGHFITDFGIEGLPDDLDDAYREAIVKIFFEGVLPRSDDR